ncbi:Verlamelin biosynthesis protein B [Cladobotryum mycophilum]|uniref:Verlamelin biosynthesis protein B n=1 Tax=Cladobotryum mycophilum TaxID=491253 RepID=A0ABR0S946_9HYPO
MSTPTTNLSSPPQPPPLPNPQPPPPSTHPDLYSSALSHFSSIPWTATLLRDSIPFIPQCVNPLSDTHDQFLGKTLRAGPRGLKHMLCYFHPEDDAHLHDPSRPITRVSSLFSLGEGLVGYHNIIHGGMIMTMADESMGSLHDINTSLNKSGLVFQSSSLTGGLDIKFIKPVKVGEVVVNAWIEGTEGRKTKIRCEVRDEHGVELARCSSTWVSLSTKL